MRLPRNKTRDSSSRIPPLESSRVTSCHTKRLNLDLSTLSSASNVVRHTGLGLNAAPGVPHPPRVWRYPTQMRGVSSETQVGKRALISPIAACTLTKPAVAFR